MIGVDNLQETVAQRICGMSLNRKTSIRIELVSKTNNVVEYIEGKII